MSAPVEPRWVAAFLARMLPDSYRADVLEDLKRDARRRLGPAHSTGPRMHLWYLRQLLTPSTMMLIWTLRRRRRRKGRGMGSMGRSMAWRVRDAARRTLRDPVFTISAVLSLGLGIGANAAVYSVVSAVLRRPPPYEAPGELVYVWNRMPGIELPRMPLSALQVRELRDEQATFEDVGGVWATSTTISVDEGALLVSAGSVTPNFFSLLGVEPTLGRTFEEDEATRAGRTVILSHDIWMQSLAGDPDALGRSVRLEGGSAVVIGVLPADFELVFPPGVGVPERLDVYTALAWDTASDPQAPRFIRTVARLREGVSVESADATVQAVAARLRATYADIAQSGEDFFAVPLQADAVTNVRPVLLVLMAGVAVFLLLTSVNVASLLMARSRSRQRELAVRTCLGASKGDLVGLMLAEVAVLIAAGTALGLAIGAWGAPLLWRLRPQGITGVDEVGLDPWVLGATAAAAALAAVVAAVGPLSGLRRRAPMEVLRFSGVGAGSPSARARQAVTVIEVALSVVLVVGAGLVGQALIEMRRAELGFDAERVLTFRVGLPLRAFPTGEERAALAAQVEEELLALPGALAAGGGSHIPLADWANWSDVAASEETPERERERFRFDHRAITPGYLPALGAELVSGRHFRTEDLAPSEPVVIVDQELAERVFPGRDPVGRVLIASRFGEGGFAATPAVVVGVVGNLRDHDPTRPSEGQVYWPFAQSPRWELTYAVRTRGDPAELITPIRERVTSIHPDLAVTDFRPLQDYVRDSLGETRFTSLVGAVFSLLALTLAGLGLYGVVSYSTLRRTKELGLHLALGARASDVFIAVVREGLMLGALGVAIGLLGASAVTRYLDSILFEVDPLDPVVFGGVAVLLLTVAICASAGPALKASRLDPVRSLQAD